MAKLAYYKKFWPLVMQYGQMKLMRKNKNYMKNENMRKICFPWQVKQNNYLFYAWIYECYK